VKQPRLASMLGRLRSDHMVRNSLYLMFSSGLQASLGFIFWIVVARLFSTADVGRASSLILAATVIGYLALLGLNSSMVRFMPTARDRDSLITAGLLVVAGCGALMALGYVFLIPVIAPRLAFVEQNWSFAAGFVLLTAVASVNLMTDAVFIASRRANYCALTDGAVGGATKIAWALILAGSGAYGIFAASTSAYAASAVVSVLLIFVVLRWRIRFENPFRKLRPLVRFSAANYAANVMNLLPVLIVPLLVLDRLGARDAAYYFVAFQIATLLYSGAYAISQSFLAEGSRAEANRRELRRRSRRAMMALYLPVVLALVAAAHWVMLVFGTSYSQHGTGTLISLALAALPIAACNWSWTVLRLSANLVAIVLTSGVYAVSICGLAWFLAPHGLAALAAAWPAGALLSAAVSTATVIVLRGRAARHRRTSRHRLPRPVRSVPAEPGAGSERVA
jgi:O-antigen/teichoic acid export membrane protein